MTKLEMNTPKNNNVPLATLANVCIPRLDKETSEIFWDEKLIEFIKNMKETLSDFENGVALAANQVWNEAIGIDLPSIFVMKLEGEIQEFINPRVKGTNKSIKEKEACLSFPNKKARLKRRHKNAVVLYQSLETPEKQLTMKFTGIHARAVQHEADHLRGKTLFHLL